MVKHSLRQYTEAKARKKMLNDYPNYPGPRELVILKWEHKSALLNELIGMIGVKEATQVLWDHIHKKHGNGNTKDSRHDGNEKDIQPKPEN